MKSSLAAMIAFVGITTLMMPALATAKCHTKNCNDRNTEATIDGRFNTQCKLIPGSELERICDVSFYKLIANPERYDGRLVVVSGFLVRILGKLVIFPNKESYEANVDVEGIRIMEPYKLTEFISENLTRGVFPVAIMGRFNAHYSNGNSVPLSLGSIYDVKKISYSPRVHD